MTNGSHSAKMKLIASYYSFCPVRIRRLSSVVFVFLFRIHTINLNIISVFEVFPRFVSSRFALSEIRKDEVYARNSSIVSCRAMALF
jgi:hypothetical protein